MSNRIKRHLGDLTKIKNANGPRRKCLLKNCSPELIDCLSECALNCLNNGIPLRPAQFNKLKRYKKVLRKIASKKVTRNLKVKALTQTGGFIGPLITAVLTALASNLLRK